MAQYNLTSRLVDASGNVISAFNAASFSVPVGVGNIWYVDGLNGSDSNNGLSPATAFATIGKAITSLQPANGGTPSLGGNETVIIFPANYIENVTLSKPGVNFVGAQFGHILAPPPTITPSTGIGLTLTSAAQNCHFAGLGILGGSSHGVQITQSANITFERCYLSGLASGDSVKLIGTVDVLFRNCVFDLPATNNLELTQSGVGGIGNNSSTFVEHCVFMESTVDVLFTDASSGAHPVANLTIIKDCTFLDANKTTYCNLGTNTHDANNLIEKCTFNTSAFTIGTIAGKSVIIPTTSGNVITCNAS